MVSGFTKRDVGERFNLQLFFIEDLAKRLTKIGNNIARASNGLISSYRMALGELNAFWSLILGSGLKIDRRDIEITNVYLAIAENLQNVNIVEGTDFLKKALEKMLFIIKQNNLLFPLRTRGLSFKKYVERELGILK